MCKATMPHSAKFHLEKLTNARDGIYPVNQAENAANAMEDDDNAMTMICAIAMLP